MIDVSLQTEAVYVPVAVILTLIMECAVNWPDPPPENESESGGNKSSRAFH